MWNAVQLPNDHRKRVTHFDDPGHGHELTFSCYKRRPLLVDDLRCQLLAEAVDRAAIRHRFSLLAFVFMPEHVHLIVIPQDPAARVSDLLYAIKRPVSYRIKHKLIESESSLLRELTIRERPGKTTFRFWQEGPGYDRNIVGDDSLRKMIDYVHRNPVRRGLVDGPGDWKWSSWRQFEGQVNAMDAGLPRIHSWP
jgi:putative transposase